MEFSIGKSTLERAARFIHRDNFRLECLKFRNNCVETTTDVVFYREKLATPDGTPIPEFTVLEKDVKRIIKAWPKRCPEAGVTIDGGRVTFSFNDGTSIEIPKENRAYASAKPIEDAHVPAYRTFMAPGCLEQIAKAAKTLAVGSQDEIPIYAEFPRSPEAPAKIEIGDIMILLALSNNKAEKPVGPC